MDLNHRSPGYEPGGHSRLPYLAAVIAFVMKIARELNVYCPKCGKHTEHKVVIYSKKQESGLNVGKRRRARRAGYSPGIEDNAVRRILQAARIQRSRSFHTHKRSIFRMDQEYTRVSAQRPGACVQNNLHRQPEGHDRRFLERLEGLSTLVILSCLDHSDSLFLYSGLRSLYSFYGSE